jgi:hypothetical protein
MATFTQAFAEFGIKLKNPQGRWSAREGNKVVITMWAERIRDRTCRLVVLSENERRKPGWHGLVKDVKYALAHCNGEVNTIMIHAQSTVAKRKVVVDARALKNKWKITHFDEAAGELTMIPV